MSLRHHQITLELELPTRTADVPLVITVQEGSGAQNSSSGRCGAMLLHGAGGDVHSGHLPAFAAALAGVGVACVVRYTARGPLASRVAVCKALLEELPGRCEHCRGVDRWLLCGHSMGGRVVCQVAADLPALALACVLLSYPLHPPGAPQQLRDAPLALLTLPLLLVRGTRDEFSTQEQWEALLPRLQSAMLEVHSVEGGDHQLKLTKSAGDSQAALKAACQTVQTFASAMVEGAAQQPPDGEQPAGREVPPVRRGVAARGRKRSSGGKRKLRGEGAAKQEGGKRGRQRARGR